MGSSADHGRGWGSSHRLSSWRGALATASLSRGLLLGAWVFGSLALPRTAWAAPVLNPDNGHYYEAVTRSAGITWKAANDAANARTYNGLHGHLVTITSPAENGFIREKLPQAVEGYFCLGGFQSHGLLDPAAGWQWVTGEPWSYTNWHRVNGTEPNDYYGPGTGAQDENGLEFWSQSDAPWNDIRPTSAESYGYVVEYEPDPSPDAPTIAAYVPKQPAGTTAADVTPMTSAPPGTLMRVTGTHLGSGGTVLFDSDPLPAAVATWSPTEILLWVPTAPKYPFATHAKVMTDRQQADGADFTIDAPALNQDNLLANGSFEYPDSSSSSLDYGYTYGVPLQPDYPGFNGYSIPGWRIPFGTIDVYRDGWQQASGQGKQSIDLVGSPYPAIIEQTFYTQSGKNYTCSGWFAHNPGIADARALIYLSHGLWTEDIVYILYAWGYTEPRSMGWTHFSFQFRAPAGQTTLTFQDISGMNYFQGLALDGLSVKQATK